MLWIWCDTWPSCGPLMLMVSQSKWNWEWDLFFCPLITSWHYKICGILIEAVWSLVWNRLMGVKRKLVVIFSWMTTGPCHRKYLKYLNSHLLISSSLFIPLQFAPYLLGEPDSAGCMSGWVPRCSAQTSATCASAFWTGMRGNIYLYAKCIFTLQLHVLWLMFTSFFHLNCPVEPSRMAPKIWKGSRWKLSSTIQPWIRRLGGKFGKNAKLNIIPFSNESISKYDPLSRNWLRNWKKLRKLKGFYRKTVRRTRRFWQRQ